MIQADHNQKNVNRIVATTRHGPSRGQEEYHHATRQILSAWGKVVPDSELRVVFFIGQSSLCSVSLKKNKPCASVIWIPPGPGTLTNRYYR